MDIKFSCRTTSPVAVAVEIAETQYNRKEKIGRVARDNWCPTEPSALATTSSGIGRSE
jgi:hypothetical protein